MPHYDVVVLGAGLPGLAAAVLCARANKRVVVFDPDNEPGGILAAQRLDRLQFAAGPVVTHGFEPGGPLRLLHATIGLPISPPPTEIAYQVALPDRRITVYTDSSATLEELRREFPREIDSIAAIYSALHDQSRKCTESLIRSFIARTRSAHQFLLTSKISKELLAFFDVQSRFFFGQPLRTLSLADLSSLVVSLPIHLTNGFHGIAVQLRDLFTSVGGEFRAGADWPLIRNKSNRSFSFDTGTERIEPDIAIVNTPWKADRTIFLGIRESVLPVSMADTVLCLVSYERPGDLFVLTLFQGQDPVNQPTGVKALTATFLAHDMQLLTTEICRERIRSIIPFIDDHVILLGEQDLAIRTYPFLPPCDQFDDVPPLRPSGSAKHLYLLRDGSHAVNRSVEAARKLASSLA